MSYAVLKLLHVFAVIIFLGNIITGLFWMKIAMKTKDLKIIAHTMRGIIKSDKIFTLPGVMFIIIGGFSAAIYGNWPLLKTGWILYSIILFSLSGISYGAKIAPLQKKIYNLTANASNDFEWELLRKKYNEWEFWGHFALITPLIALIMMTLKIPA